MQTSKRNSYCLWLAGAILFVIPLAGALTQFAVASSQRSSFHDNHDRFLRLYNTHTAECIDIVYRRDGTYIPDALAKLDFFLRDHRTGEVRHFDPRLFDLLHDLTASLNDPRGEIDVVCGYRTPLSNEFLR